MLAVHDYAGAFALSRALSVALPRKLTSGRLLTNESLSESFSVSDSNICLSVSGK